MGKKGGSQRSSWSPQKADDGRQWLELTYPQTVKAKSITVYETFNPGAIVQVDAEYGGKWNTVWQRTVPQKETQNGISITEFPFDKTVATKKIKLILDTDSVKGYNEIDAVSLNVDAAAAAKKDSGKAAAAATALQDRKRFWAVDAKASSTYTNLPQPKNMYFQYRGPQTEVKYDAGSYDTMQLVHSPFNAVMAMERPKDSPYLNAVRILMSLYDNRASNDVTLTILDTDLQVIHKQNVCIPPYEFGMFWKTYHLPSVKVPEKFYVVFDSSVWFIFVGQRFCGNGEKSHSFILTEYYVKRFSNEKSNGEKSHSFIQTEDKKLEPLRVNDSPADWLIRGYFTAK